MPIKFYEESEGFADYQRIYSLKDTAVYTFAQLHEPKMEAVLEEAQKMYRNLCRKWMEKNGDPGTCVMGNGIYIAVRPPRKRNIYRLRICFPQGQSESPGYACKDAVLKFLEGAGVHAWYECGRMD